MAQSRVYVGITGINDATSIIRDCEQMQIERGRISTGGVDEC